MQTCNRPKYASLAPSQIVPALVDSGCATKLGMFVSGNINPLELHEFTFEDGYTSGFYTLQKSASPEIDTLLFFVGDSSNVSHNYYLQKYFEKMHGYISIYVLQKRYVGQREKGLFGASESFYKYNHYAQLVQD